MSDLFPTMPVELLSLIFELSITHSYHSTTYAGRQRTLRNLCLASKQFRQIARPLLYEIVKFKSQKTFKKILGVLGGPRETGLSVKNLVCRSWTQASKRQWLDASAFDKIVTLCPQLYSLNVQVVDDWNLSLDSLTRLHHLSNLHLSGVSLRLAVPLPSLRSLTLVGSAASHGSSSSLDPVVLPAVGYLAFSNNDADMERLARTSAPGLLRLLPQLDAWSIDFEVFAHMHRLGQFERFRPVLPRTLVDISLNDFDLGRQSLPSFNIARHLRLLCFSVREDTRKNLAWISKTIGTLSPLSPLQTIYVNSARRRFPGVTKEVEESLDKLEKACEEKGVEVVYEEQPQSSSFDSGVSEDFWRRMEGRREELSESRGN